MKHYTLAVPVLFALLGSSAPKGGITWDPIYEDALARAASEKKVVFIAVNMDGERANDRMVKEMYKEKSILELSTSTINLIASNSTHSQGDKTCKRFGGVSCPEHRRVDVSVRGSVLKPDAEGYVIAPQHVWLGPDGAVILSVPYAISVPEMEWCFVTALRTLDPGFQFKLSSGARAPRALVMGDVAETQAAGQRGSAPPTREEALELLDEIKRGGRSGGRGGWAEREQNIRRLVQADEPEAREYVLTHLRAAAGGRWGGGGGGRGSGEGEEGQQRPDRRATLLRWIGEVSPPSYWEVCAEFISSGEDVLRKDAVVALEQLAAPESLKVIRSAVKKEKDPMIRKNLYRALGTAGNADKGVRKILLKEATDKRNELWRLNSIIALGFLAPDEDVDELLRVTFEEKEGPDQVAAVLSMAITRNTDWLEVLKAKEKDAATSEELRETLKTSIEILEGGPLWKLVPDVKQVASDEIVRRRSFGSVDGR